MKKYIKTIALVLAVLLASCAGIKETINLSKCDFSYSKISQVNFMDVDLSNGFTLAGMQQMLGAFTGNNKSIPLGFTVHMNVKNPNAETASLEKMAYKISLDGVEMTEGVTTSPFTVAGKSSAVLSLPVRFDLKQMLSGESRTAVTKVIKNFVGINAEPVNVKVQIKPSFRVGKKGHITFPGYVPVNFQYSGKAAK